jgi:spore germination protein KB
MSRDPGRMGVAEGFALAFIPIVTPMFLPVWSVTVDIAATAAWLVPSLESVFAALSFLTLLFVFSRVPGDLADVAGQLLGRAGAAFLLAYLAAGVYIRAILFLRQFGEYTLLTAMPDIDMALIVGWYALLAALAAHLGLEPLVRAAWLCIPFALAVIIFLLLMLHNKFHLYNLAPWPGAGLPSVLDASLASIGALIGLFALPILARSFQDLRTMRTAALLALGLAFFFRTLILFVFLGCFSVAVGREKVLPFFELTRLVYISPFLQRMEPFFILLWVIFAIATLAIYLYLVAYLLARLFALPSVPPLLPPLAFVAVQIAFLPDDAVTAIRLIGLFNKYVVTPTIFAVPSVLLLALLFKGKGRARRVS